MPKVKLKNGVEFNCDYNSSIFEGAKNNSIILEHSCLNARCRSCKVKVLSGITTDVLDDLVLTEEEKALGYVLSCNAIPKSDLELDVEDLGEITFYDSKIIPAKIESINFLSESVLKLELKLPPNAVFKYNSGQYVNISKGDIKRSYSLANAFSEKSVLTFYIKNYKNGQMSKYWFNEAKVGDLLRIEGPKGSFFYRESEKENIIFLATGTGIAPVKAIIENLMSLNTLFASKKTWIFNGGRNEEDLIWQPPAWTDNYSITYVPVLSRATENWNGERGYIQDVVISKKIDLTNAQVYACGSDLMIASAREVLVKNGLDIRSFYSDAFVATN